jgi:hypothetical protein
MRSILNTANLPRNLHNNLWAEAAHHSTDIINGTCTTINPVPPYFVHLKVFGDLVVVASSVNKKITAKISNRGYIALYLGRAPNH